MNLSTLISSRRTALTTPTGIPAQRTSDAYTAYASVHELSVALGRTHDDDADLRPTA